MKTQKHPFPMYIEAHAGSSVVVGCSGHTHIGTATGATDQMEADLIRIFRALPLRERVDIMSRLYRHETARQEQREKIKKAPAGKGRGKRIACCCADT